MLAIGKAHEFTAEIENGLVIVACVEARHRNNHRPLDELYERMAPRRSEYTPGRPDAEFR